MGSREQQRGRRDRFIVIPFSSTCRSAASVDVVRSKKPQGAGGSGEATSAPAPGIKAAKGESLSLVARLLRGFKNLSHQIFAVYDEEDEDEEEPEMVIGLPTDVKHVAHIGWDGSTSTTSSVRSWNRAAPPPGTAPAAASASTSASASSSSAAPAPPQAQPPALSARQFELAMAAQASAAATAASTSGAGTSGAARRHRHYS